MISSDQISIVIQGAVGAELTDCIRSARQNLPEAEIILSTWKDSLIPHDLPINACVFSTDPGAKPAVKGGKLLNNTNRQLVSTMAGLRRASRPYTLKLRTDFRVDHAGFISGFTTTDIRDESYTLFKQKIVIPNYATRFPESGTASYPFHPSDLSLFGLTEDIIKLFDVPQVDGTDWDWALEHEHEIPWDRNIPIFLPRYAPEQHFFVKSLQKNGHRISLTHYHDTNGNVAELSRRYMANNFVILNIQNFGISTSKPALAYAIAKDIHNCYSENIYKSEYRKWCDPKQPLTWRELLEHRLTRKKHLHEKLIKHRLAMQQHAKLIFQTSSEGPLMHSHKMLADALASLYYFVRTIL